MNISTNALTRAAAALAESNTRLMHLIDARPKITESWTEWYCQEHAANEAARQELLLAARVQHADERAL